MSSMIIRRVDEATKARLRICAARHGRSMEEEAREILKLALTSKRVGPRDLAASIRLRFVPLGGVELPGLPREAMRRPPKFGK